MKQRVIEMNRDKLLNLLSSDEEIQNQIRKIVSVNQILEDDKIDSSKEEIEMLSKLVDKWKKCFSDEEDKNNTLNHEIDEKKNQLLKLKDSIDNAKSELDNIKAKLSVANSDKKDLSVKIEGYKTKFDVDLDKYELYRTLTDETKISLKGIFKDDTFEGFIACGVQDKNINSLWDYIKNELIENSNQDNESLVKIFDFFFMKYIIAYPMFEVQNIEIGEDFNTDFHIKDSQSSASGTIKKVLLKGWINTKTNSVIRKSVIRI